MPGEGEGPAGGGGAAPESTRPLEEALLLLTLLLSEVLLILEHLTTTAGHINKPSDRRAALSLKCFQLKNIIDTPL